MSLPRWGLPALALLAAIPTLAALAGCATGPARTAATGEAPGTAGLLPARIRRLTSVEVERSLGALTGIDAAFAADLPPDVRQEGYTPNAAQTVSAAWATSYAAIVGDLARRAARERLSALAPCAGREGCRAVVVRDLGRRAYRRPLDDDEQASLEELFSEGEAARGAFAGGVEVLLRALAQAPSFLYVTELGERADGGDPQTPGTRTRLDGYEIASALSYMLRGGPPDDELLDAARAGALSSGDARVTQARRIIGMSDTRYQFRRFALEWLEVDRLLETAKSAGRFPRYEALAPHMLAETEGFADEVMVHGGASVQALLGSGFASVDVDMARFYGLGTYGPRASLAGTGRLGVLQQASFLAAHASEDTTSPVKRGDFVMRKLLCERVKRPAEIGLEVVMPAPSERLTNRQRFDAHAGPGCAGCHERLDALGFTFEGFDAVGHAQATDHGNPVVTAATVSLGGSELAIDGSAALTRALVRAPGVAECFARHAFRYFSAQSDPRVETSFLALRGRLGARERDNLFEALLAYVGSDLFVIREVRAP